MNCEDIEKLSPLWHTGELEPARQTAFDTHVATCQDCADALRSQISVDSSLRDVVLAVDPHLQQSARRIETRVAAEIAGERSRRWLFPSIAAAAAAIAAVIFIAIPRPPAKVDARVLADASRDHTVEVIQNAPRHWRTDPSEIAAIVASQGVSAADVKALEATGYRLDRAKICRVAGLPYLHLVYAKAGREFSVYMRKKSDQPLPDALSVAGSLQVASFSRGRVQAVVVTEASVADCDRFTHTAEAAL